MNLREVGAVYLSGPVTGVGEGAARASFAACLPTVERRCPQARVFVPTDEVPAGTPHAEAMGMCLREMLTGNAGGAYDLVVLLPGWRGSEGCRLEAAVAEGCGIPCCMQSDLLVWGLADFEEEWEL